MRHGIKPAPLGLRGTIGPDRHLRLRPAPLKQPSGGAGVILWGYSLALLAAGSTIGIVLGHWLWH